LKLLAPDADRARFEREARAVASLGHPNITQVYDYGEWEGRPYMLLEYVPDGTLEDRLAEPEPLPDADTAAIAGGIAAGLAHAHSRGVVHRDLKPANVLFDAEGRPKLADFGIARLAAGGGTLTEAGTVLGTAAYISPEQAMGESASAASDVYSFGVILYRMLTGRLPFESADPMQLVLLHRDAPPPALSSFRADAPAVLEAVATAALQKDPRDRPADGGALVAALAETAGPAPAFLTGDATQVLQPTTPTASTMVAPSAAAARTTAPPPTRRSRAPLVAALLLLLAAGGGALAYAVTRPASPALGTASTVTATTRRHTTTAPSTTAAAPPTPSTTHKTTTAQTTTHAKTTTAAPTTAPPPTTILPVTTAPSIPATTATVPPPTTTVPPGTTTVATTVTP
jgi:serine/threonine-protein kinase